MRLFVPFFASILLLGSVGGCIQEDRSRSGEQRATINGVELAYEVVGEGEPVLFIPSVVGDSFEPLMHEAALNGYMLIKYHPRGMGHSEAAALEDTSQDAGYAKEAADFLRFLGVERAHVVGHSAGGAFGLRLAIDAPDLVHSLVLLEGITPPTVGIDWQSDMQRFQDEFSPQPNGPSWPETAAIIEEEGRTEGMMTWINGGRDWEDRLSQWIPDVREQVDSYYAWQDAQVFSENSVERSDIENISQPALYVWSEERVGICVVHYHYLQEMLPQMQTAYISGIGHGLHLQDPTSVAEVIGGFLAEHPM